MAEDTFQCSIVTPERAVLETEAATFVSIPAHDGEIGFLAGRAPLLCQLGIGVLRVEMGQEVEVFYVDRGFAQMAENKLTVLTEQARRPAELDRAELEQSLKSAESEELSDKRLLAIKRAKTQLAVLDR
ncbi:MAG: ATP synthase F1 subunit epsilon [Acidobacteriota bacterium]